MQEEFERQLQNLIEKDYPKLAGLTEADFLALFEPLKEKLSSLSSIDVDLALGKLPFVIVVSEALIPIEKMMEKTELKGKGGITKLFPHASTDFAVIDSVSLPSSSVYLISDIDRGNDTINVIPEDAMKTIIAEKRSPLTIAEGVALITQFPDFLIKNHCFSLLASRHPGDQRVPAIWINAANQPNLGWCWDRNPHTWLGSASCKKRVA